MTDGEIRSNPALRGQQAYEMSLDAAPLYHDGTPRKAWSKLGDVERWSWERRVTINGSQRRRRSENGERGHQRSLSKTHDRLHRYAAAGAGLDHPRLNAGSLNQNILLLAKGSKGIARNSQRLMPVKRHVAGLQSRLVQDVTIAIGPFLQNVYRVFQAGYLPDQLLSFLQVNRPIEGFRVHCYLTENVGDQQGKRFVEALSNYLISSLSRFKGSGFATPSAIDGLEGRLNDLKNENIAATAS